MRLKIFILVLCMSVLFSENVLGWTEVVKTLDERLHAGLYPGASLIVGKGDKVLFQHSVGDSDQNRIYDVASLTKVIITTTLVMSLEEKGRIGLKDQVSKYVPAFSGGAKDKVTVEDLLRHRAGLPAGMRPLPNESFSKYIERIAVAKLSYAPGTQTVYSDLSFILLGHIVEMISRQPLEEMASDVVLAPLKMENSAFNVLPENQNRCAPTAPDRRCEVHDPTAFHLLPHHVGNAGLFSTISDINNFVQMILGENRILSEATIKKMLTKDGPRGLGWDFESEFSDAPRGEIFPRGISFGHTGYTGTTIWIDPVSKNYYILLSNRVAMGDERTKKPFSALRKKLSTQIGRKVYSP